MRISKVVTIVTAGLFLFNAYAFAADTKSTSPKAAEIRVTPTEEIKFFPLDQKAGDKGPQASVVFGDLKKRAPIGLLLKLPAGFRPGPHLHTSDNYVTVVKGTVHNFAAGKSEGIGIGPGGTWFQPGDIAHDNHCKEDSECLLFVYLPKGFDFKPPTKVADSKR